MITFLRKNIGTITASFGLIILMILTYGDIGEISTKAYWDNVLDNLAGVGVLALGLTLTQWSIKQGVCEQALQTGLNKRFYVDEAKTTLRESCTPARYAEHSDILKRLRDKSLYLPFFLAEFNSQETSRRKNEFLLENNFSSEESLFTWRTHWWQFKARRLRKKYRKIKHNITVDSLKWSTTEIIYDKYGRIQKLEVYRKKRAAKGLLQAAFAMIGTALIASGMFLENSELSWLQKTIKFATYIVVMAITVIMGVVKNYEKGAFGVANELLEINNIWYTFEGWTPTQEAITALAILRGEINETKKEIAADCGTGLQEKQKENESV